jgi:small subunit ribosomal protein S2
MKLFELGAHRGNAKSKLNSRLSRFIHSNKNGISIIDLVKTIDQIEKAASFMYSIGQKKGQVLLVATSQHIKHLTPELSNTFVGSSMPYINNRWLGGTLTNWLTIKKTLKTLAKLESIEENKDFFNKLAKNEQLRIKKQKSKISKFFDGLRTLKSNHPKALLILDVEANPIAVKEANVNKIPVIGLTNTKVSILPKSLATIIPCNTNSVSSISFITEYLIESYNEGLKATVMEQTNKVNEKVKS